MKLKEYIEKNMLRHQWFLRQESENKKQINPNFRAERVGENKYEFYVDEYVGSLEQIRGLASLILQWTYEMDTDVPVGNSQK